jgi:hypothetical protein
MLFSTVAYSQNIYFTYDRSGNRTSGIIAVVKESNQATIDSTFQGHSGKQLAKDLKNLKITVFPNPTSDKIILQCDDQNKNISLDCYFYSVKGELLKMQKIDYWGRTIDLNPFSSGTYYLKIKVFERMEVWKIIKQ